jgi:putative membrane protein
MEFHAYTTAERTGMVVKNLISATVTGLLMSAVVGSVPAAAQQAKSLASDSTFIVRSGSAGVLQVKLGQLAEKKGSSPAVVEFGKRMAADYSKTNEELKTAAKQAGFPSPVLSRQDQQIFDRFNSMGRSSFDKNYMAQTVAGHSEAVQLFQRESKDGLVQSLKQLASKMLPEMEQRLNVATETARSVGVDVAAATAKATEGSVSY